MPPDIPSMPRASEPMSQPMAITVKNLCKEFKKSEMAVRDLSFEIAPGEAVAFLGPNGAGKSTTIKLLCGILTPTSGSSKISGEASGTPAAAKQLGLVFGTRSQLHLHLTVLQCLDLIAEIYYITGSLKKQRIELLAQLFNLGILMNRRVRTLSLGERMRCEVVAALIHFPKVLLLDEPTIGLDIVAKNQFRELLLRWLKNEQATLLLTSHDLSDAERLCGRCLLIDHGQLKFDGTLEALKGDARSKRRFDIYTRSAGNTISPTQLPAGLTHSPHLGPPGSTDLDHPFIHRFEADLDKLSMQASLETLSKFYGDELQDIRVSDVSLEEIIHERFSRAQSSNPIPPQEASRK